MNLKKVLGNKYAVLVIVDLLMMVLLIINLSLILFDWLFSIGFINNLLLQHLPIIYQIYDVHIHQHFQEIDLVFVIVFLSEFCISWIVAIFKRIHTKWFFYPFLHWYDLVGCIPVGSMRFIRVLRVFSILIRLQNLGIIDLSKTSLFTLFKKYYMILVEEISDRVVVNILEGLQEELTDGGMVMERIITGVIKPRQLEITEWISKRIEHTLLNGVAKRKREIHIYVQELINDGLQKNEDIKSLKAIPVMGKAIADSIEKTISNVINNIIDSIIADLGSPKNKVLVNEISELVIEVVQYKDEDARLNELITRVVNEIVEEIKNQVKVKKWLLKEQAEKNSKETEKMGLELLMADE